MRPGILVLGAGDMGSAIAHALFGAGFAVAIADDPAPAHPRRGMAFADALWDGRAELAGAGAMRVDTGAALWDALVV
jgi:xanthine dehydrogenase accessory factor